MYIWGERHRLRFYQKWKKDGKFDVTNESFGTYISCVFGDNSDIQTAFVGVSDLSTRRLHQTCYAGGKNDLWGGRHKMAKYNTVELPSMMVMTDRREMESWRSSRRWLLLAASAAACNPMFLGKS